MQTRFGQPNPAAFTSIFPLLLYFLSGAAGLSYEILWFRDLKLLFGSTAQATATVVAVFFTGMSLGSIFWGKYIPRLSQPLKFYGYLETGVAVFALPYLALLKIFHQIYGPLFTYFHGNSTVFLAAKFLLAAIILLPPTFLMGGTFPAISQLIIRNAEDYKNKSAKIYAINTFGAVIGAMLTGTVAPYFIGYQYTYGATVSVTAVVGLLAIFCARHALPNTSSMEVEEHTFSRSRQRPLLLGLSFLSGFFALIYEISWTRIFAQILQNSLYTFSAILSIFLLSLAAGAALASQLVQRKRLSSSVLFFLIIFAGAANLLSLAIFPEIVKIYREISDGTGFALYNLTTYAFIASVMFIPGLIIGTIFPYLLKFAATLSSLPANAIGKLYGINILGSIIGSLFCGFFLIQGIGTQNSLTMLSLFYFLLALTLMFLLPLRIQVKTLAPLLLSCLLFLVPFNLKAVFIEKKEGRTILDVIEGSHATVIVEDDNDNLRMKVNSNYTLGDTLDLTRQHFQAELPLYLHPAPQDVFFLGLGTGITAGWATRFQARKYIVCELLPEVVQASKKYFSPYVGGLFTDKRVSVLAEDGRSYLQGSRETFDLIIGDLFLPWKAGAGTLYTKEHFSNVLGRLNEHGRFFQWLPLYQMSAEEFKSILKTFTSVFPSTRMWHATLYPDRPTIALDGSRNAGFLQPERLRANITQNHDNQNNLDPTFIESTILMYYAGNISKVEDYYQSAPLNTEDQSFIEFHAPVTQRRGAADDAVWMKNASWFRFLQNLWDKTDIDNDPYLSRLNRCQKDAIRAGRNVYRFVYYTNMSMEKEAEEAKRIVRRYAHPEIARLFE